jgi:hypothetical protein
MPAYLTQIWNAFNAVLIISTIFTGFIYLRINIFDAYTLFARRLAYFEYCHRPANRQVWRYQNK